MSTTETEYINLSQAMRNVIPLIRILQELEPFFGKFSGFSNIKCTVFKDNQSCFALAKASRMNAKKVHFFEGSPLSRANKEWEGKCRICRDKRTNNRHI